ncbi:MAG: hypothetical protein AB7D28_03995 [Candidatus Berkiella sp.]
MDAHNTHPQPMNQNMDSPSLLSLPVRWPMIQHLHQSGYLDENALFYSWRFLNRHASLGHFIVLFCQWLGTLLLLCGTILLMLLKWQDIPALYQVLSFPLLLLSTLLGAWLHHFRSKEATLFLLLGALLTCAALYQLLFERIIL